MDFEWNEAKRRSNLDKHGLDFRDALDMFDGRPRRMSGRHAETKNGRSVSPCSMIGSPPSL